MVWVSDGILQLAVPVPDVKATIDPILPKVHSLLGSHASVAQAWETAGLAIVGSHVKEVIATAPVTGARVKPLESLPLTI